MQWWCFSLHNYSNLSPYQVMVLNIASYILYYTGSIEDWSQNWKSLWTTFQAQNYFFRICSISKSRFLQINFDLMYFLWDDDNMNFTISFPKMTNFCRTIVIYKDYFELKKKTNLEIEYALRKSTKFFSGKYFHFTPLWNEQEKVSVMFHEHYSIMSF